MRKITLLFSSLALGATAAFGQTIATFDDLTLPGTDTCYINYSASGTDVGFNDGLAHFPCIYDTAYGGYWQSGFAYSNKTDSVTSGYTNEYSAKTAIGQGGSAEYAVAYCYNPSTLLACSVTVGLLPTAAGHSVSGVYVTNNTYAYNSMKNGDAIGKKFGGATGNDPDWFLLTIWGIRDGVMAPDSVTFYLADYRFADNDSDYIVKTWQWVNLLPLGHVDSLIFSLTSSDNSPAGMNTPAYFCIDNFTTDETGVGVPAVTKPAIGKMYPVPATDMLHISMGEAWATSLSVCDISGRIIATQPMTSADMELDIHDFSAGTYFINFYGQGKHAEAKFVKQ